MEIEVGKRYRRLIGAMWMDAVPIGDLFVLVTITKTTVRDKWGNWYTHKEFRKLYGEDPSNLEELQEKQDLAIDLRLVADNLGKFIVATYSVDELRRLIAGVKGLEEHNEN